MDGDVRAVEGQTMLVDNRRDPYMMVEWNASLMSLAYLCGERDSTPRTGTQVQGSGYPCACNHHCQRGSSPSATGAEPLPLIQYCFRTYGGAEIAGIG